MPQLVQGQVAAGLEEEGLEMVDTALAQDGGHPQVGFLDQVLGDARVFHHSGQGTQQRDALGEKDGVELG
ncbi:hypothetical protein D3C80_1991010 [compost metagenome]